MNIQKRVLFINNTSELCAGTSQSLLLLLDYLSADYNVSVVSDRHSTELPQSLSALGVPHYAFRDRTILYLPQLVRHILVHKIDLVYANNFSGRSRVAFWASRLTGRPFIWHVRESFRETRGETVHLAEAVIANSQDTARRLKKYAQVKAPIIVPNGVELSNFKFDKTSCRRQLIEQLGCEADSLFVINIGRICEAKNQFAAVQVAKKTLQNFKNVHFIFLGNFQDAAYVQNLKIEINATVESKRFHLVGFKKEFIPILMGCDVLLHTAQREPQGRVIIEAMSAKLPVVAFDIGGVGEAIQQAKTGFLRPMDDIDGLAHDLECLLHDPMLRHQLGQEGFKRVCQLYTAEKAAELVKDVIENTVMGRYA
jgi:glycosyltransferase involved in cell wall biosynthesis